MYQVQDLKFKIQKLNSKVINFSFFIVFLTFAFLFLRSNTYAQTMENSLYRIQMGNLNSISGESTGSEYNLSITSGESAPGVYTGTNYTAKAGFQYIPRSTPFTFTISNTLIDFGSLSPTNPVSRTTTLIINNSTAQSYKVTAAENHELQVPTTGAMIPDTTCDDGQCTESKATKWDNTLTYGFGYRCDMTQNSSCVAQDKSFTDKSFYKHFSNTSKKETAATVLSGGRGIGQNATITYKVNISSSQPAGFYENAVTFLATPSY